MKSYILASIIKNGHNFKATVEWNVNEMVYKPAFEADNRTDSLTKLKEWLYGFLDCICVEWLKFHQKEYRGGVNCPNGLLQTGTDTWLCKLGHEICELQSVVELGNEIGFITNCKASDSQKSNIIRIIKNNIYKGFHHSIGRYQCPKCQVEKKEEKYSFHYPWEFVPLIDLPINQKELEVLKSSTDKILSRFFVDDPIICTKCAMDLIARKIPNDIRFEILEYEVSRENLNL